jgi:hypothetical protein
MNLINMYEKSQAEEKRLAEENQNLRQVTYLHISDTSPPTSNHLPLNGILLELKKIVRVLNYYWCM